MRKLYAATGAILLLAVLLYSSVGQNYTSRPMSLNLSSAINSTRGYLQSVNSSAYLVFYPNLAKAYSELYLAMNQSFSNQSRALALLNESRSFASAEQSRIDGYRAESAYALGAITIVLAAALYALMRPFNGRKAGPGPRKQRIR
ncbi:MAG: hypothetical protein KGH58_01990 [Candidatus Micrarchaeota archaeon]|nr:hypothetical protein [Candidatus Micrarchaeota archaeon]